MTNPCTARHLELSPAVDYNAALVFSGREQSSLSGLNEIIQLMWARFKVIGRVVGDVQGRAIVTAFYYTILAPFAIGARLTSDPLRLRSASAWLEREPVDNRLDGARQQG